jgi:hypothetical protein
VLNSFPMRVIDLPSVISTVAGVCDPGLVS